MWLTYTIIAVLLLAAELIYFRIANHFNFIDKPNERSSHSTIVLRGGGILFVIALWIWGLTPVHSPVGEGSIMALSWYPWMFVAVTLAAGVSFIDDIHSLPGSVRLVTQFVAMLLMFYQLGMLQWELWWAVIIALIVCVGATNIINFMDGINGITGAYAMATLLPLIMKNEELSMKNGEGFVEESLMIVVLLSVLVFSYFNFRPSGKAKCFAGDVGSIGMAFILLFIIGLKVMETGDVTYLVFLVLYGLDGVITICHRIMLHENLGEAHRKHSYQIMANELKMSHVTVSLIYAVTQLCINLVFVYVIPNTVLAHWIYMIAVIVVFGAGFLLFRKKYYHLHEEYLALLK